MYARYKKNQDGISEPKRTLDPINDGSQSSGRFPKAPLPQLSSLAHAPVLSSSSKSTTQLSKFANKDNAFDSKPLELGRFENRRGTQLAPVKLNALKMPPSPASKKSSGLSFMPKGSSLSKNMRRTKEEDSQLDHHILEERKSVSQEDFNDSTNSDEDSKYSYEDSGDDLDKGFNDRNLYDGIGLTVSPSHSAYESPDALDINSLVQLNSSLPQKHDLSTKSSPLHHLNDREGPPSLSLRKIGQPTSLKPLQPTAKKKPSPKKTKNSKDKKVFKYYEEETRKTAGIDEDQNLMLENIQKEWITMQEEFEKEQKSKYELMVKESSKKLEEEESLIKKQHSDHILKLKSELEKKMEEERANSEKTLSDIKNSNDLLYKEEEQKFKEKLDAVLKERDKEISDIKEKSLKEIQEQKMLLDTTMKTEVESLKKSQENKLKELMDSHSVELELLEKAHTEKINELNKEKAFSNKEENEVPISEHVQVEVEKVQQLLKEKKEQYQKLTNNLSSLEDKVKLENEALKKLEEKLATSQVYYEEIQDEVDKTENDLDLLREEKSALISELSILKENISNEKSNLLNIEKSQKEVLNDKNLAPTYENKSMNTEVTITTICQAIQTYIDFKDAYCQINDGITETQDMSSQTCEMKINKADKYCQSEFNIENTQINSQNVPQNKYSVQDVMEDTHISAVINKSLEIALSNMTNKMDERFKEIEKHIGSLSQKQNSTKNKISPGIFEQQMNNLDQEVEATPFIYDLHVPHSANVHDTFAIDASNRSFSFCNQKLCSCVQGDTDSCDVMQDVKSSIYRLNDILNQSFVPTFNSSDVIPQLNPSLHNFSSPIDSFYTKFRNLQEKHRMTKLKHKCQNEAQRHLKDSSGANQQRDSFPTKDIVKSDNSTNTNIYAIDYLEDPLMRARNLVLKEKARVWKQAQMQNSLFSPSFAASKKVFQQLSQENHFSTSDNISRSASSRTSPGLSEISPTSQHPFLNFESDPASDYNAWMLRLNTLQQRIRSHKFI